MSVDIWFWIGLLVVTAVLFGYLGFLDGLHRARSRTKTIRIGEPFKVTVNGAWRMVRITEVTCTLNHGTTISGTDLASTITVEGGAPHTTLFKETK